MASSISLVSLLSAILSLFAIGLTILIIRRVYQEQYKRPWVFIGVSAIFLALSELIRFLFNFVDLVFWNIAITQAIIYFGIFISIAFLSYGLLTEYFILKLYKGKFVKFKFIPVQEGSIGGEIDLNISQGNAYFGYKKDKNFLLDEFTKATKNGFEGFLISETNPRDIRKKYQLQRSPIAWLLRTDLYQDISALKSQLDENADVVDPLQLNDVISYVDTFLEQSARPFLFLEMDSLFERNSYYVTYEFLQYMVAQVQKYQGILLVTLNRDVLSQDQLSQVRQILRDLE